MRKDLRFGFSSIITLGGVLLLAVAVIVGVYLVGQKVGFRPRASELQQNTKQESVLQDKSIQKKIKLLIFNPVLESKGNKTVVEYKGWNDPEKLTEQIISDFREVSGGYLNYTIAKKEIVDGYERKKDGFSYNDQTLLSALDDPKKMHNPNDVDYAWLITSYRLCEGLNNGQYDEVWLYGGPLSGYKEGVMAGPGAFGIGGEPITGTSCSGKLPIMGFNYERGVSMALESYGHRVESVMNKVFGGWAYSYGPPPKVNPSRITAWDKFSKRGFDPGEVSGCGNIHGSANTPKFDNDNYWGYDWTNKSKVKSICDNFSDYPNNLNKVTELSCKDWGDCSDCTPFSPDHLTCRDKWLDYGYAFKKWWFSHLPREINYTGGIANNWWNYVVDYDRTVSKKAEVASCKVELFENDPKNTPGAYHLKSKLAEVFPGQTIVIRSQVSNNGNVVVPDIRTYTSVSVNSKLLDGSANCKGNKPIGFTCDFSKTKAGTDLVLDEVNVGTYRFTLPDDLVVGSEFAVQLVLYRNQVNDSLCSRETFQVRSK